MKLTFLGTSSGTPTKSRNVSGLALSWNDSRQWFLVDCGEGTQHQVLKTPYTLNNLQAIFITHMHGDHCYGLPGLLASATMAGRTAPLTVVGPVELKQYFEIIQSLTQMRLTYEVNFIDVSTINVSMEFNDFSLGVAPLSHRVPSWAYCFTGKNARRNLHVAKLREEGIEEGSFWGQLQKGESVVLADGRRLVAEDYLLPTRRAGKVVVAGDNDAPELLMEEVKTADVFVHEATYTEAVAIKVGNVPRHSYAKRVAMFAESLQVNNLVLTHFSQRYRDGKGPGSVEEIELEARKYYRGNLLLAQDLNSYSLDKDYLLGHL